MAPICNSGVRGSVLVVAADTTARLLIAAVAEEAGHHVHFVDGLLHAEQCLHHPEFDFNAAIFALPMPDAKAEQCAAAAEAGRSQVSVMFIGSEPGCAPSDFLRDGRAVGWLARPFTRNALLNMLQVAVMNAMRKQQNQR